MVERQVFQLPFGVHLFAFLIRFAVDKLTWAKRCISATGKCASVARNAFLVAIRADLFFG